MAFSSEWDKIYSEKAMAAYPDNTLIRFVAKHYYNATNRKDVKFLDVGCGAGSSSWFLAREGFSVAAIDSSPAAMERLRLRLKDENLEAFLGCGDITQLEFKPDYFDCVIDISSLCYLHKDKIEAMMKQLYAVLKPNGRIFSLTPTDNCSKTVFNYTADGLNIPARFQTADEAIKNFKSFKDVNLHEYNYDIDRGHISLWVIDAIKK
jgi:2-polyprenyl-3-methyl-5-hydroxy-6-metoxy-1,4-benzoquinol methylase